jgi:hypothetical protein
MNEEQEEKFSDDPMEHFRIENEILKMKLKAQFGDAFQMFTEGESIPPDLENQFLKNMIQFEENYQNAEFETIREKLGNPNFPTAESLQPNELKKAIETVQHKLEEYNIKVDFLYEGYDNVLKYKFLSEELLDKEIEKELPDGATCNFIYEEFHPNHQEDLQNLTHQFVLAWVTKNIEDIKSTLAKDMLDVNGNRYKEADVVKKVEHFFEAFDHFKDDGFNIDEVKYTLQNTEEEETGMGHGEGALKFDAVIENGEEIHYEGPYKIYYCYEFGYWYVMSFVMPGFNW